MAGRSYQTKPGLPSGCQLNIKCFYAKSTCLGSNYRNISSLTLVQRSFQDTGLWIIIAELTCGLFPMIFRMVFPSCNLSWAKSEQWNDNSYNITVSAAIQINNSWLSLCRINVTCSRYVGGGFVLRIDVTQQFWSHILLYQAGHRQQRIQWSVSSLLLFRHREQCVL
jgi:hypothetical protein